MIHVSVMPDESLEALNLQTSGVYVDGTLGAGGHTERIARQIGPNGMVIAFDRDVAAIDATEARLRAAGIENVRYVHADFRFLAEALDRIGMSRIDGILLDIGLSSDQLADRERGFSFESDGPLDMRFDTGEGEPAWRLLEHWNEEHIADMIYRYGEERFSRRIARRIVEQRQTGKPLRTAAELAAIVRRCVPPERRTKKGQTTNIDPATRTFQGLRIAVNDELGALEAVLKIAPERLKPGGRLAVISFHSLEDRIVKSAFREDERLEIVTKKPIMAGDAECRDNPRARSAKLRVACRRSSK